MSSPRAETRGVAGPGQSSLPLRLTDVLLRSANKEIVVTPSGDEGCCRPGVVFASAQTDDCPSYAMDLIGVLLFLRLQLLQCIEILADKFLVIFGVSVFEGFEEVFQ